MSQRDRWKVSSQLFVCAFELAKAGVCPPACWQCADERAQEWTNERLSTLDASCWWFCCCCKRVPRAHDRQHSSSFARQITAQVTRGGSEVLRAPRRWSTMIDWPNRWWPLKPRLNARPARSSGSKANMCKRGPLVSEPQSAFGLIRV